MFATLLRSSSWPRHNPSNFRSDFAVVTILKADFRRFRYFDALHFRAKLSESTESDLASEKSTPSTVKTFQKTGLIFHDLGVNVSGGVD